MESTNAKGIIDQLNILKNSQVNQDTTDYNEQSLSNAI